MLSSWAMRSFSSEENWLSRASRAFSAAVCSLVNFGARPLGLPEGLTGPDDDGVPLEVEADDDGGLDWGADWVDLDC